MKDIKLDLTPRFNRRMSFFSKKGISGTFMAMGGLTAMFRGEKKQQFFKGKGMIFDGFREYSPQDDARMIDWKASLKANKKLVRKFTEEKNKNIVFLFDVSSSMSYSSHLKLKNEFAAELIASLTYSFLFTGDSIGLVMFSDHIKWTRAVSAGQSQWNYMCQDLENPEHYGGKFSFSQVANEIMGFLNMDAVIILVTDMIGLENDNEWHKMYKIMATKFELVTLLVRDPFDNFIPTGLGNLALESPFSARLSVVDTERVRTYYNGENTKFISGLKSFSDKLGADFLMLSTEKDFFAPVMDFLNWREMSWR